MMTVYVLGAGASRFAGYPLGPKLWSFVRDWSASREVMATERRKQVLGYMDDVLRRFPPRGQDGPNLEELFTLLDLSLLIPDALEQGDLDWRIARKQISGMITDAFLYYQWDLQNTLYAGNAAVDQIAVDRRRVLEGWATRVRPGDVIISFNWDLLTETALSKADKWSYRDGYGFECNDGGGAPSSPVQLLKLHGSVNWVQDNEYVAEPAVVYKAEFFGTTRGGQETFLAETGSDQGRKLIIPTYLKRVSSNALLARLWTKAGDALRQADQVIVIGYRLHRADTAAHQLFTTALLANGGHPRVEVVSPGGPGDDNWDELCKVVGYDRPGRTRKPFEGWIPDSPTAFTDWR
jgi:hypothetical protein